MTNDDIIRMAREAGLPMAWISETGVLRWGDVENFARLIYKIAFDDANRAAGATIIEAAVARENEACAKLFDGPVWSYDYREIAEAIRARGKSDAA